MILIYSDHELVDSNWLSKLKLPAESTVTHNLHDYLNQPAQCKLAFVARIENFNHRSWHDKDHNFDERVRSLSLASNLVFCIDNEMHDYNLWNRCHYDNVHWCLPGLVHCWPDVRSNMIFWGDWFETTASIYKNLPDQLAQIQPYQPKPKYFDALLGGLKPHRDWIANRIKESQLQDQITLSYGGKWVSEGFYAQDYWIWEENCQPCGPVVGSGCLVDYYGQRCLLAQVIPTTVYNNCAYSIVAETHFENDFSFFTEKTAKCLIGRRPFVAFSSQHFLQDLQEIGFETFGSVIDESYDSIESYESRWAKAFEQVAWLCQQPQQQIIEKLQPVLEHNFDVIMQTNWTQRAVAQIQAQIDAILH